jgi:hypothetical protein
MDLYLKFDSEAQATEYLYRLETVVDYERELTDEEKAMRENNFAIKHIEVPNYANIDTIGTIYEPQEIVDPENPPEPVLMEGWHVNVRLVGEDGSALEPFKVEPEHPRRVWG